MASFTSGRRAEAVVVDYLRRQAYALIDQNWRTRYCEIDIVVRKANVVYFVEVKYRQSGRAGFGFDYITNGKLRRMRFAAELWVKQNNWTGDYSLAAVEVMGRDFAVTSLLTDL